MPIVSNILTVMANIELVMNMPKKIRVMRVMRFILRISRVVGIVSMGQI